VPFTFVFWITFLSAISLWTSSSFAQGVIGETSSDKWRSSVSLYVWGSKLDGTALVAGNEVDIGGGNLADHIGGLFSGHFESRKDKWGYFLDLNYVRLDPNVDTQVGIVSADVKDMITEVAGVYQFNSMVKGVFGVRHQSLEVDLHLPFPQHGETDWTDGFIGLRVIPVQTDKWHVWLRGDVSVVGDSDTTWHAVIGAAYRFNPKWSVLAAYRVLSNDIDDGSFKWDVVRSGVGLAVTYSFQ